MSGKIPRLNAKEVMAVLKKLGFSLSRQSGSHKIYKNREARRVTLPFHGSKSLHPKVLRSILKDAEITTDELRELL